MIVSLSIPFSSNIAAIMAAEMTMMALAPEIVETQFSFVHSLQFQNLMKISASWQMLQRWLLSVF